MESIGGQDDLDRRLREEEAVLLMFGGRHCGVCHALRPRIELMLSEDFPKLTAYYVDCHGSGQAICAQRGIFSLPVVQIWFGGRQFDEFARVFSLADLESAISRPYRMVFG